jgi:hypothetical protein
MGKITKPKRRGGAFKDFKCFKEMEVLTTLI